MAGYLRKMTQQELNIILTAYNRRSGSLSDNSIGLCSHSYEKDLLYKHDRLIRASRVAKRVADAMMMKIERAARIAENRQFLEEFRVMRKSVTTKLLYCASLLIDFHAKNECSEYLALALKLKLGFYDCSFKEQSTVLETMVEYLNYITRHVGRDHELFTACIDVFVLLIWDAENEKEDPSIFPKVFDVAHRFRFNVFNYLFTNKWMYYLSPLVNLQRFMTLAVHGYEEECLCDGALRRCHFHDLLFDRYTFPIGLANKFRGDLESGRSMYRPFQVLYIYEQQQSRRNNYDPEIYEKALHLLWETIADPYITEKHFMSFVSRPEDYQGFLEVWKWYSKIVLQDVVPEGTTPRSLMHLARVTIRRRLTQCAQLPYGVEHLDPLPQKLKSYLCLE